jgi:hypothetical protein
MSVIASDGKDKGEQVTMAVLPGHRDCASFASTGLHTGPI